MPTQQPTKPIILYWHPVSGHSHRAQLFLSLLRQPFEIREVNLLAGAQRQPEFLAINPLGKVPAIDDNGTVVYDSNAILTYLAIKYDPARQWFPADPEGAAAVVRHLSFAAGPVTFGPANARLVNVLNAKLDLAAAQGIADKHLPGLDAELAAKPFLGGSKPTIGDVANYSYIAHAPEGGISLERYPNIRAWLARIEALPGFVPMKATAVGHRAIA